MTVPYWIWVFRALNLLGAMIGRVVELLENGWLGPLLITSSANVLMLLLLMFCLVTIQTIILFLFLFQGIRILYGTREDSFGMKVVGRNIRIMGR
jgi:hypothetical protein